MVCLPYGLGTFFYFYQRTDRFRSDVRTITLQVMWKSGAGRRWRLVVEEVSRGDWLGVLDKNPSKGQ